MKKRIHLPTTGPIFTLNTDIFIYKIILFINIIVYSINIDAHDIIEYKYMFYLLFLVTNLGYRPINAIYVKNNIMYS